MHISFVVLLIFSLVSVITSTTQVYAHPKGLLFPVAGGGSFSNDFNSPRADGPHNATDIFASKMTPILAAVSGTITYAPAIQPSYGFMVSIRDAEGFNYDYIHMNNDYPGTDDGNGGPFYAYAPDIKSGNPVVRGQHIGYVGDSGNAENTPPHLHFEITKSNGEKINPYPYLLEAERYPGSVAYPALPGEILPYGSAITASTSIAIGKFDNTGTNAIVSGAGPGVSPHVKVIRTNGTELGGFYAYDPRFHGGVNVASGDVDGDGIDEIITGTVNGAPHVRIFRLTGQELGGFYAYDPSFTGGVNVASVDTNSDGIDEILVGAGPGGSPHVKVLHLNGGVFSSFYAYDSNFHGGIDVAGGDVTGGLADEIVTAPGPGGGPHVRIFSASGIPTGSGFSAYSNFTGGARISVGNVRMSTAKEELIVSPWANGGPHLRLLDANGAPIREGMFYESWWRGRYDVAAGEGTSYISTGFNRRSSVRAGLN